MGPVRVVNSELLGSEMLHERTLTLLGVPFSFARTLDGGPLVRWYYGPPEVCAALTARNDGCLAVVVTTTSPYTDEDVILVIKRVLEGLQCAPQAA